MNRSADTGQRPLALPADTPVSDDCTPSDYSRLPFPGPGQERSRPSLSGPVRRTELPVHGGSPYGKYLCNGGHPRKNVAEERVHPLEGSGQVGTPLPWFFVFKCTPTTSPHDRQRPLRTASEFSLVAVSTADPESHQSPIRIKAKSRRRSCPWPMFGPRKPLVPTPVHMRRSQISWLPCGSNLFVAQA
jgi:hypothetical protein